MTALYIVLSVVVVVVLAVLVVLAARRRRSVEAAPPGPNAPPPTTTPPRGAAPPGPAAAPVGAPAPEAQPVTPAPRSFRDGLGKTRGLFSPLRALRSRGTVEAATWEELEEALLRADVGVGTTDALLADLRRKVKSKEVAGGDQLLDSLRADLVDLLRIEGRWDAATDGELALSSPESPGVDDEEVEPVGRSLRFDAGPGVVNVWLFVGVNGVGKTTTIGKLARQQSADGRSVLLAAGDTFRAAAGEQLARWAERAGTEIVRGAEGGDPSAIVFDAVQRAAARGNDLVLADTAGRLHTKVNLVE